MPRCTESGPILAARPMPHSLPGQWTAHATVARRVGGPNSSRPSNWPVSRPRSTARWPVCAAGTAPNASSTRSVELLAAAARAGTTARGVGRLAGAGQSAAGHDQVFVPDRFVGEEVFEDFPGPGGVAGLG